MSSNFSSKGLNTFDLLGDLTPQERTLTRILLRQSEMTEKALYDEIIELPESKQMSKTEMKEALEALIEKKWVHKVRANWKTVYTIRQQKHR
jgi:hypothetical protein